MSDNTTATMQAIAIVLVIVCIMIAYFLGERNNPKGNNKGRN